MKKYLPIINKNSLANQSDSNSKSNLNNTYTYMRKDNSSLITSDHLAKVNLLHEYINCKNNKSNFCKQNLLNKNNIKRAVLIRDQLHEYLKQIVNDRKKKSFFENIAKSKSN
jgi:hypothetical protein